MTGTSKSRRLTVENLVGGYRDNRLHGGRRCGAVGIKSPLTQDAIF